MGLFDRGGILIDAPMKAIRLYSQDVGGISLVCARDTESLWRRELREFPEITVCNTIAFIMPHTKIVVLETPSVLTAMLSYDKLIDASIIWIRSSSVQDVRRAVPRDEVRNFRRNMGSSIPIISHNKKVTGVLEHPITYLERQMFVDSNKIPFSLSHPALAYAKMLMDPGLRTRITQRTMSRAEETFSDDSYTSSQIKAMRSLVASDEDSWAISVADIGPMKQLFTQTFPGVTIIDNSQIASCGKPRILVHQSVVEFGVLRTSEEISQLLLLEGQMESLEIYVVEPLDRSAIEANITKLAM
ncbi:hypothetical protein [Singapore grouper iridovirus]|nr:hypothetical protein [Singapore grouper iridovirus]